MMTEAQRIKFSALFLEKFGISIDPDNELLPLYYITYHSSLISNRNNKKVYESVGKMMQEFKQGLEEMSQASGKQVSDNLASIEKLMKQLEGNLAEQSSNMDLILNDFDKQVKEKMSSFETNQYHFNSNGQAFWYSFGKFGLPVVIALLLLFIVIILFLDRI